MGQVVSSVENIADVVNTFAKQIGEYSSEMEEQLRNFATAVNNLGSGWESSDYDKFAASMQEKINRIQNELAATGKLKEYLDSVASELAAYLEQLRQAGEDQ